MFQNFGGTFVSVSSTRFEFKSSYHWLSSKRQNVKVPSIGKFQDRKMESSYLSVHSKNFAFKVPSKKFHSEMVFFHTYIPFLQKLKVPSQIIGIRAGKNLNFGQEITFYTILCVNYV